MDVEEFLTHAGAALAGHRRGDENTIELLRAAEAEHTGEFLAEDPQEWSAPLGEEVRAVYTALLRALTSRLRKMGDIDEAVRCMLKLLEQDSYDEQAHLGLLRAHLAQQPSPR